MIDPGAGVGSWAFFFEYKTKQHWQDDRLRDSAVLGTLAYGPASPCYRIPEKET